MSRQPAAPAFVADEVEVLVLGSGTSTGVPMIGCDCPTCTSNNKKDIRTRSSIMFRWQDGGQLRNILVDCSTDLWQQSIANDIRRVDSVLFTHAHADHVHGIDELRSFNFLQKEPIPCYGSAHTIGRIKSMFDYIFDHSPQVGGGKPSLLPMEVEGDFTLYGRQVSVLPAEHGSVTVFGYRVGAVAYLTDCKLVPEQTIKKLMGVKLLIIGAVQLKAHGTHMNLDEAVELSKRIGAGQTYLTHLNHAIKHDDGSSLLPDGVQLAYDGLLVRVG